MAQGYWFNQYNYWPQPWYPIWYAQTISRTTAVQIAQQHVQGQVVNVQLDRENGRLVYEVYIGNAYGIYEVDVDAYTGEVLKIERD